MLRGIFDYDEDLIRKNIYEKHYTKEAREETVKTLLKIWGSENEKS